MRLRKIERAAMETRDELGRETPPEVLFNLGANGPPNPDFKKTCSSKQDPKLFMF